MTGIIVVMYYNKSSILWLSIRCNNATIYKTFLILLHSDFSSAKRKKIINSTNAIPSTFLALSMLYRKPPHLSYQSDPSSRLYVWYFPPFSKRSITLRQMLHHWIVIRSRVRAIEMNCFCFMLLLFGSCLLLLIPASFPAGTPSSLLGYIYISHFPLILIYIQSCRFSRYAIK